MYAKGRQCSIKTIGTCCSRGVLIKWVQHTISNIAQQGPINIKTTTREVVNTMIGDGGRTIGSGFNKPNGKTICRVVTIKPRSNKRNILVNSQGGVNICIWSYNYNQLYITRISRMESKK